MLSFFMVFFSSIRRWSEQSTTLLLPDFVATDYFYLNIFFTTWEILDIHIYFMWKPIKKNQIFSEHISVLRQHFWNELPYFVVLYFILYICLQTSSLKKMSKCWLNLQTMWTERKKCKSSFYKNVPLWTRGSMCHVQR